MLSVSYKNTRRVQRRASLYSRVNGANISNKKFGPLSETLLSSYFRNGTGISKKTATVPDLGKSTKTISAFHLYLIDISDRLRVKIHTNLKISYETEKMTDRNQLYHDFYLFLRCRILIKFGSI